jgi:hypothetical protein
MIEGVFAPRVNEILGRYREGQGSEIFFFVNKKEAKKTLLIWDCGCESARAPRSKSFLLLFYKKEALRCLFFPA